MKKRTIVSTCVLFAVLPSIILAEPDSHLQPIEWTFDEGNPVIRPGQLHGDFDAKRASCCSVVQFGDVYRMYYWAEDADEHYYIAQAETQIQKPHRWVPKGIILERQPDKPHNSQGPCYAQVIPRSDEPWLMYICAWGSPRADGTLPYGTNLVLSHDKGMTWRYHGDEYIFPHTEWWNKKGTGSVCVIKDGDKYRAYYTSFAEYQDPPEGYDCFHAHFHKTIPNTGIGYAESKNGIKWTYPLDRWAVSPRGPLPDGQYEYLLSKPWVIKDGDGYRMWCGALGSNYRIRSLTSEDGLNWEFHDHWVIDDHRDERQDGIGAPGSFDDTTREYPMVIKQGDEYHLWYTGNWFGQANEGHKTGMGFAVGRLKAQGDNN
jgi:hypothetical protein